MATPASIRLHARRLQADFRVPADHPDPERVRAALTDDVATRVPSLLAALLPDVLRDEDGGVWMIRRLELDVQLHRGRDPERLARAWAGQIAAALRRVLDGHGDPSNVVHFPSPADQLASFLGDTLDGCAARRWYHRPFDGLRMLPVSAVLRTSLERDRATGVRALGLLAPTTRRRLVVTLTDPDAERVCELLTGVPPAVASARPRAVLAVAFGRWLAHPPADSEPRARLQLLLDCLDLDAEVLDRSLASDIAALVRASRRLRQLQPDDAEERVRALADGDHATTARRWDAEDLVVLLPLLREPPEWLEPLLLQGAGATAPGQAGKAGRPHRYTPFGGAVLLLPILVGPPWRELPGPETGCPGVAPHDLLRLLVVLECLGPGAPEHGFDDEVVRELYGVHPALRRDQARAWTAAWRPEQLAELRRRLDMPPWPAGPLGSTVLALSLLMLRAFAGRLPGFARSSPAHLRRNFLDVGARVEVDGDGRWLAEVERPPLHLVLHMTGLSRGDVVVPWLADRTVSIRPAGES